MCLYVKRNGNPFVSGIPQIAVEDIAVYKVLRVMESEDICETPYYGRLVLFNKKGDANLSSRLWGEVTIPDVLESIGVKWCYANGKESAYITDIFEERTFEEISDRLTSVAVQGGLHSFSNETTARYLCTSLALYANKYTRLEVFKATIPKGACYFIGVDDDMVSDTLIIHKNKKEGLMKKLFRKFIKKDRL